MDKPIPQVGDFVKIEGWSIGDFLLEGSDYKDSSFPGCQFYMLAGCNPVVYAAVNIKVTGRKPQDYRQDSAEKWACRIEFVGDGVPSSFSKGYIWFNSLAK